MKRQFLFSIIVLIISVISCDTGETVLPRFDSFVKLYGENSSQFGVDIAKMPNSDLIILGRVDDVQTSYIYLSRVDTLGNVIWEKTIRDTETDGRVTTEIPKVIKIDNAGNIIIAGTITSNFPSTSDIFVYKVGSSGEIFDSRIFDIPIDDVDTSSYIDVAEDLLITEDNKYLISGYTKENSTAVEQYFHVLLTESLRKSTDWDKQILPWTKNPFSRKSSRLEIFNNESFLSVVSSTNNNNSAGNPAGYNLEVLIINNESGSPRGGEGDEIDGTNNDDAVQALIKEKNSTGFIYAANIEDVIKPSILIGKIGSDGTFKTFTQLTHRKLKVVGLAELSSGQIVFIGKEKILDDSNLYLAGIDLSADPSGNLSGILWEHSYGGEDIDEAAAMVVVNDRIFALGTMKTNSTNKIVLLKTSSQGRL